VCVFVLVGAGGAPQLKKQLGWFQLTTLGIGGIIGAGIFVITGLVARYVTGPALAMSYVFASFVCLLCKLLTCMMVIKYFVKVYCLL
jgi:amino acid transporter